VRRHGSPGYRDRTSPCGCTNAVSPYAGLCLKKRLGVSDEWHLVLPRLQCGILGPSLAVMGWLPHTIYPKEAPFAYAAFTSGLADIYVPFVCRTNARKNPRKVT
jgi:hypothetical protein